MTAEKAYEVLVPIRFGELEGGPAVVAGQVDPGTVSQEGADHLEVALLRRAMQRRPPAPLPGAGLSATGHEERRDLEAPPGDRRMQRTHCHLVSGDGLQAGAAVEKEPRRLRPGEKGREM
jgi:hypothetical protein